MSIPKIGEVFQERYLIRSQLGAGGMGTVFRATQTDVGREVALKLLRHETIKDNETIKRFYREFKILSRLEHPNIVTIYGMALDDANLPYAVCEFIEGKSLRSCLAEEGALSWQRALRITVQICNAMQFAHNHGVTHRDLKPDNIMILQSPEPDFVKLIDFGLSRAAIVELDESQRLTMTGQLLGTPNYMSPDLSASAASNDIYALGCILFEMLSGKYLFDADSQVRIFFLHTNQEASTRFDDIETKIPAHIFDLMKKMLSKTGAHRPQSMAEIETELKSILSDPGTLTKFAKKDKPNWRIRQFLALSILICSIIAGTLAYQQFNRPTRPKKKAGSSPAFFSGVFPHGGVESDPDLKNGEEWLTISLTKKNSDFTEIVDQAVNCLLYRMNARVLPLRPPYADQVWRSLGKIEIDKKIRTARQFHQRLNEGAFQAIMNQDVEAVKTLGTLVPSYQLGGGIFLDKVRKLILGKLKNGEENIDPYLGIMHEFFQTTDNQTMKGKSLLINAEVAKIRHDEKLKSYVELAYQQLLRAHDRAVPIDEATTALLCDFYLNHLHDPKQVISVVDHMAKDSVESTSVDGYMIRKALALAYLKQKEIAKAQRIAMKMRDQVFEIGPREFNLDETEEVVLKVLSTRKNSSKTARAEAQQYLQKIFFTNRDHYVDSLRYIYRVLHDQRKSRSRINQDVVSNAAILAQKHPALYRQLNLFRIELLMHENPNLIEEPSPELIQKQPDIEVLERDVTTDAHTIPTPDADSMALTLAGDILKSFKKNDPQVSKADLKVLQKLYSFFEARKKLDESLESRKLLEAIETRFK